MCKYDPASHDPAEPPQFRPRKLTQVRARPCKDIEREDTLEGRVNLGQWTIWSVALCHEHHRVAIKYDSAARVLVLDHPVRFAPPRQLRHDIIKGNATEWADAAICGGVSVGSERCIANPRAAKRVLE